jgi:hydroxymethylpyrimidine/phosphomethylpyrimidine kinase
MAAARTARFVLAVGGSDPCGGAGVQADTKTLEAFGVSAATAVTAVTVQTATEVRSVHSFPAARVAAQFRSVVDVLPVRVVKCGMLATPANVRAVAALVAESGLPVVVDPVYAASGGRSLGGRAVLKALRETLIPSARVVTANVPEAEAICSLRVVDEESMAAAARALVALGARAAVVKGGHLPGRPVDVLFDGARVYRYEQPRRYDRNMHGTGCAFASAVAAGLALDKPLSRAVADAAAHVGGLIAGAIRTADGGWVRASSPSARVATRHPSPSATRRAR